MWPKNVEIDVVAQHGHLWIEVKDSESFGVGSTRFLGSQGHVSGKAVLTPSLVGCFGGVVLGLGFKREVKDSESFAVGSTRFLGSQGHVSGKAVLTLTLVACFVGVG